MLLQRMDQVFLEVAGRERFVGNLAQSHDRVLVLVAIDGDRRALRDLAGTVAGEQNELEAVIYFVDAVFNGDTGHCLSFALGNLRI
ncbi:hypothetical protein D3C72_1961480 [compost metagenome]